jgi:hypothetical protein
VQLGELELKMDIRKTQLEKLIEEVQKEQHEARLSMKKSTTDITFVMEEVKMFCHKYKCAFEEHVVALHNVAKMCVSLTECLLIDQGLAATNRKNSANKRIVPEPKETLVPVSRETSIYSSQAANVDTSRL